MQKIYKFIRLRDAPDYLAMDKNRFRKEVRPELIEIPLGKRGIAFDRLDLDTWAEHYKQRNGRPVSRKDRRDIWDEKEHQGLGKLVTFGTSTRKSTAAEFAKVLAQVNLKKQKNI